MMDIEFLWTAATGWKLKLLVIIMIGQIALTIWLYLKLGKVRVAAVKAGKTTPEEYTVVGDEPEELGIYTRAVANQFELPVLFYVIILIGLVTQVSSWVTVILALVFLVSRIIHAKEMVGENRVLKRRRYFIRSVQIFILLMIELVISILFYLKI